MYLLAVSSLLVFAICCKICLEALGYVFVLPFPQRNYKSENMTLSVF